jgi:ribosomal protein S18 acetylase RimI-like enzyme
VDIRLRPLRDDEFPDFLDMLRVEYVRGMVAEAGMTSEAAEEKATADHASLFPDGGRQAHHRISVVEDAAGGEPVGYLFWAPRGTRAFLYELLIDEPFRGQGLGRRVLELFEAEARTEGLPGIDLNVWGGNEVARRLYRSVGFNERAVFMSKELE